MNLYEFLKNFPYKKFIKQQLIYIVNPISHFKSIFKDDEVTKEINKVAKEAEVK